jgi:histidine triad (HIT) family protein
MPDCIFCKIVNKEISCDLIYEDDKVLAFLDIKPASKGHALVIPKVHSQDILTAQDVDLQGVITRVKKIANGVLKAVGAAGFNLHVNTHPAAGQVVMHTHFHIIPRFANDGLKMWPHHEIGPKTRALMAEEIKKFIS